MRTTGMISEWLSNVGISLLTLIGSMSWVVGGTEGTERSARQPDTVRVFTLSRGYCRVDTSYLSILPILQPPPQTLLMRLIEKCYEQLHPLAVQGSLHYFKCSPTLLSSCPSHNNPMTPLSPTNCTNTRT